MRIALIQVCMKVCLIKPPKFVSLTNFVSTISMPPLGLAYIAAAIREGGHDVAIVDAPGSAPRSYHLFNDRVRVRGKSRLLNAFPLIVR